MPNPSFEPKTHRWRPGAGAPSQEVPSQNCAFCAPKEPFFGAKRPRNGVKTAKRRQTVRTLNVRLNCRVPKSPFVPSSSTKCPRNGPKRHQKAPKSAQCAPKPQNQGRAVSWATWLKIRFPGHLVHPQPHTFCRFQVSESPNEPPRPPYQWSLGGAGGQPGPRTAGANGGSTRVHRGEKNRFVPKLFLDKLRCSNKCF